MRPFSTKPGDPKAKILQKHMTLTHVKVQKGSYPKCPKEIEPEPLNYLYVLQYIVFIILAILFVASALVFLPKKEEAPTDPHALYDQIMKESNPQISAYMQKGERISPRWHYGTNGERSWARKKRHVKTEAGKPFHMSEFLDRLL